MIKSYKIFTTPTCKNCPSVKEFMKTVELNGQEINAADPKGREEAMKKGIRSVPTILFFDEEGQHIETARSINEIKQILNLGDDNES